MLTRVLNYLCKQGGLGLFAFPGDEVDFESVNKVAQAMNGGASFVVFDFSHKSLQPGNHLKTFFKRSLTNEEIEFVRNSKEGLTFRLSQGLSTETEQHFRTFYRNMESIRDAVPYIFAILPDDLSQPQFQRIASIAKFTVIAGNNLEQASAYLEDNPFLRNPSLVWLFKDLPNKKKFRNAYEAIKRSYSRCREIRKCDWTRKPEKFANALKLLVKAGILDKNPLDGFLRIFRNLYPLFILVVVAIPFLIPSNLDVGVSHVRERALERDRLSMAPSFEYTFDGKESMQRIARYAIGRFKSLITDESMVKEYVQETLKENGYPEDLGLLNDRNIPPEGTVVKFSKPEYMEASASDSIGNAWKYWTSVVSDSIAYLTEFYHEKATKEFRQHNGIDVASRQGARILAPFAAKAWTSKDERGGIIIGLVREKDVVLFMHCDQLLYLDGQEVMQGDPIATVGVTGHTTGPHAHIVTGLIDPNGDKRIGNIKYKVIDPIKWYYRFKPTLSR